MAKRMTIDRMLDLIREYIPTELNGEILNELAHRKPEQPDYEGDRRMVFPVCPECHSTLKGNEYFCTICGKAIERVKLKW